MKIGCLVVDDEPYAVNLLAEYISHVPFLYLQHTCYNALQALDYLKSNTTDLILLDINMPHLSGMQLATLLPPGQQVIFITAYADYAVESYEKNAVDYLLKPVTFERFLKSVNKVKLSRGTAVNDAATITNDKLFLKTGKTFVQLGYDEVYVIEGLKDYVMFYTEGGNHIAYKRMKELEETLPKQFARVHNSYIINCNYIQKVEDNHVYIRDKRIPTSEKYREQFLQLINSRLI